ncbi:MAG: nitroreductase family protein [Puniceicoccales bacterium]|jgi:nitroreductase|nr:nitroreductase family protein [Puniceicoccales bacterium]
MKFIIHLFVLELFILSNTCNVTATVLSKNYDKVNLETPKKNHYCSPMDAILSRQSVRDYTSEPVATEQVSMILKAGFAAPSAMGSRPWHFLAIDDRTVLGNLAGLHSYAGMLRLAPFAVLICGDRSLEVIADKFEQNCSAATENILIAATALGLGSVWVGIYPDEGLMKKFREALNIPEKIFPFAIVPIGYPKKSLSPRESYIPERVHMNRW